MRVLLVCPIPLEFSTCRTILSLRDGPHVGGCPAARGEVAGVETIAVESGPAKARAAAATVAAVAQTGPDVVLDTGTCGALDGDLIVGALVLGTSCLEYDISGNGLPDRIIPEMKLPSGLDVLPRRESQKLSRGLIALGNDEGLHLRVGAQASGELFIQSLTVRESLFTVSGALACNWETAGVFIGALRSGVPPLSLRVVSDMGDEDALRDFRRTARRSTTALYRFLLRALEEGWMGSFHDQWKALPRGQRERLPQRVLP